MNQVGSERSTMVLDNLTERPIASEHGMMPVGDRSARDLEVRGHLAADFEDAGRDVVDVRKVRVFPRHCEHVGREPLLDRSSSTAVLDPVYRRLLFSFAIKEPPNYR